MGVNAVGGKAVYKKAAYIGEKSPDRPRIYANPKRITSPPKIEQIDKLINNDSRSVYLRIPHSVESEIKRKVEGPK